jgi:ACS family tartrate transporter-like MFS transporter
LAAAGLAWAANLTGLAACIAALAVVNLGITAAKPPLWSMPTLFLGGAGAAAGIALINSIGNLGGFFGPYIVGAFKQRTGSYDGGLYAVAASLVVSAVLAVILSHRTAKPSPVVHEATKA